MGGRAQHLEPTVCRVYAGPPRGLPKEEPESETVTRGAALASLVEPQTPRAGRAGGRPGCAQDLALAAPVCPGSPSAARPLPLGGHSGSSGGLAPHPRGAAFRESAAGHPGHGADVGHRSAQPWSGRPEDTGGLRLSGRSLGGAPGRSKSPLFKGSRFCFGDAKCPSHTRTDPSPTLHNISVGTQTCICC